MFSHFYLCESVLNIITLSCSFFPPELAVSSSPHILLSDIISAPTSIKTAFPFHEPTAAALRVGAEAQTPSHGSLK